MKGFFNYLRNHQTQIFLICCAAIICGSIFLVVFSAVKDSKDQIDIKIPATELDSSIDKGEQSQNYSSSKNEDFSSSSESYPTFDYNAETQRINDEYNAEIQRINDEYDQKMRDSEEEMKRIEDKYNARMKEIEQTSGTSESEAKLQEALENARRQEEEAKRAEAEKCPNAHAKYYAIYQNSVREANNAYNAAASTVTCPAFGGCPALSNAESIQRQATLSAMSLYKQQMSTIGCNWSDYVDW